MVVRFEVVDHTPRYDAVRKFQRVRDRACVVRDQMLMVGHQDVGEQKKTGRTSGFGKRVASDLCDSGSSEYREPVVTDRCEIVCWCGSRYLKHRSGGVAAEFSLVYRRSRASPHIERQSRIEDRSIYHHYLKLTPIQNHLAGIAFFHDFEALGEVFVRKTMRDDWGDVEAGF